MPFPKIRKMEKFNLVMSSFNNAFSSSFVKYEKTPCKDNETEFLKFKYPMYGILETIVSSIVVFLCLII